MQRRRRPTYFLSRLDPAELSQNVRRGGNEWVEADHPLGSPEDLIETLATIRRLSPAAATQKWLANWQRGIHELHAYRSAQRAVDGAERC